jgi:hypothetical protein
MAPEGAECSEHLAAKQRPERRVMCRHSPQRAAQVQHRLAAPPPVRWSRDNLVRAPLFQNISRHTELML